MTGWTHTPFTFTGATDEELFLVCLADNAPERFIEKEDGWEMFRIEGTLDFSLVGILAKITTVLADRNIGLFAISACNTGYVPVKHVQLHQSLDALTQAGHDMTC